MDIDFDNLKIFYVMANQHFSQKLIRINVQMTFKAKSYELTMRVVRVKVHGSKKA